jgi:hypothetical protein
MTYSIVETTLGPTAKPRADVQWTRESLRRADKNGKRKVYIQRMLIKLRVDAALPDIRRWYIDDGESMKQIAARLQTTSNCIWRRLRKMGVEIRAAVRYNRKPKCRVCGKPSKGYSELCPLHWRLHAADRSRDWWRKNKKKGACCPVDYSGATA